MPMCYGDSDEPGHRRRSEEAIEMSLAPCRRETIIATRCTTHAEVLR